MAEYAKLIYHANKEEEVVYPESKFTAIKSSEDEVCGKFVEKPSSFAEIWISRVEKNIYW